MNTSDSVALHPHLAPDLLLSAIVDSSDDAIVSKDLNGIVTSWNRGAERLFGYSESEMIGLPILKLIPPERSLEEPAILERLRRGERVDHFTTQRICKDGKLVDVSLTISPIRNREGAIVGASKIARDVGAQKQATRALAEAAAEMDRQSRMKDEFLATLSHELRTPLQSIFGWVQLLRSKDHDDPELNEGLAVIERNARAQQKIVDDLLDMNRILSGKARLEVQQVVLAPLIEAAIATARPAADAKGVRIQAVFDSDSKLISGDPDRLQQVFWNLLSNAVKFTPKGGRVQILVQPVSSHVEVSVSDTGMGIADEFLPYVFDRFRQADASCTRTQGGLGLGLAIVKHLVELHGGTVRAKSAGIGKGATFEVCLPVTILSARSTPPRSPVQAEPKPPVSPGRLDGISVLLVDDDGDSRRLIAKALTDLGATVATAASSSQALGMLSNSIPEVIISDIGMPGESGYDFIRKVRLLPAEKGGKIPAIALTAYNRMDDRVTALRAGFQSHIAKPAEIAEIVATVQAFTAGE